MEQRRSLDGLVVAVTSSRRAQELAHLIESYGGTSYLAPTIGIEVLEHDVPLQFLSDDEMDIAIFLTGPGTESAIAAATQSGVETKLLEKLRKIPLVIARSSKPRAVLTKYGVEENVKMPREATLQGVLELLGKDLEGKMIGIFWHGSKSGDFAIILKKMGAKVFEYSTYSYSQELKPGGAELLGALGFKRLVPPDEEKVEKLIEDMIAGHIDVITFTSPPSVANLFTAARKISKRAEVIKAMNGAIVVSIGPSTTKKLVENGVRVDVEPREYRMGKMIDALGKYMRKELGAR
ncbi:MAG: uroporphyrinogen-III synthase [Nitrososphaerales archaeon]